MLNEIIICEATSSECLYPYCTQHSADICIPAFQRLAFQMCLCESTDFQMSPSDIGLQLNILL
jgi:hypothetical protein